MVAARKSEAVIAEVSFRDRDDREGVTVTLDVI
jgi:hypothetical protein